jgi:5'(3')-deoxyribonucleotidase
MISFYKLYEYLNNKDYIVYCDLDGVLVDLERGVREKLNIEQPLGRLGIMKGLAQIKKNGDDLVEFFGSLPWTADGERLWNFIKKYDATILTGGGNVNDIMRGKDLWVAKNLNLSPDKVIHETNKKLHAQKNTILIDDYETNVREFNNAGGIGIQHVNANNTINTLKNYLE